MPSPELQEFSKRKSFLKAPLSPIIIVQCENRVYRLSTLTVTQFFKMLQIKPKKTKFKIAVVTLLISGISFK